MRSPAPFARGVPAIFALAAFWRGASAARTELLRRYGGEIDALGCHAAILRHERIATAAAAGHPLEEIPEFAEWLGPQPRQRPAEVEP